MTYAILKIPAAAYQAVRARLVSIDERIGQGPVYQTEYVNPAAPGWRPEHLVFGPVGLEAGEPTDQEVRDLAKRLCALLREDEPTALVTETAAGASTVIEGIFSLENVARKLLGGA